MSAQSELPTRRSVLAASAAVGAASFLPLQLAAAAEIMAHAFASIEFSEAWLQVRGAAQAGAMRGAIKSLNATMHQTQQMDDIINGVGRYFNPATDAVVLPPLGFERYCQDALGLTYGENGATIRPNCQQLAPVP